MGSERIGPDHQQGHTKMISPLHSLALLPLYNKPGACRACSGSSWARELATTLAPLHSPGALGGPFLALGGLVALCPTPTAGTFFFWDVLVAAAPSVAAWKLQGRLLALCPTLAAGPSLAAWKLQGRLVALCPTPADGTFVFPGLAAGSCARVQTAGQ
ncbi:unnamed protein product [Calypogeia fissa]